MLMCRICLTSKQSDNITDSSCYSKLFIQLLDLKNFNETLHLCMWCKAALRRTMAILNLALESQKILQAQIPANYTQKLKSLHTLNMKIKKQDTDYKEYNFEVIYLDLCDQIEEIKLKKFKCKKFEFQCVECGLSGPYKCELCSLHFKSQDVLSQHKLSHRRRFKCLQCSYTCKRWAQCLSHRTKCGGIVEPTICEECSKIFNNEHSLKVHMKIHKTEKKYCCAECGKKFMSKQHLRVHIRSHSGMKPFSCTQCARSFSTSSNLRAHSAVHTEFPIHYCVECHSYYKTDKSLKRHFKESAKHAGFGNKLYPCKECTKEFSTEKLLNSHISTRHGTEYKCQQCDKT
ncbi:hypothetical protein HW555_004970, partial [Spodoptera exigua]